MKYLLTTIVLMAFFTSYSQDIYFDKATLVVNEPFVKDKFKTETFKLSLKCSKSFVDKNISIEIQKSSESTYNSEFVRLITTKIDTTKKDNTIFIDIMTDPWTDEDKFVIISANWVYKDEKQQIRDTLFIKNTYPSNKTTDSKYTTTWKDGKRTEIFIGTNFDFIDRNVSLSDWYGGLRIFLPSITNFGYNNKIKEPRWGLYAGIYRSKSLSNFGNIDSSRIPFFVSRRPIGSSGEDSTIFRIDSIGAEVGFEINNWGTYLAPIHHCSSFESYDNEFITNIYVGLHIEVIRRNVSTTYSFDTLETRTLVLPNTMLLREVRAPQGFTQTFYDSYFGLSFPVMFLWKDILDLRVNPILGGGFISFRNNITNNSRIINNSSKSFLAFYLIQFDLLVRLGGLNLNIGGEVRGLFPAESPIFMAYLGTSFSIKKLADFISK